MSKFAWLKRIYRTKTFAVCAPLVVSCVEEWIRQGRGIYGIGAALGALGLTLRHSAAKIEDAVCSDLNIQ